MSLPHSTNTEDEAQRAALGVGLVGVRNDRRIEVGGPFDRVLLGQVGADQELPFAGHFIGNHGGHCAEVREELIAQIPVASTEIPLDRGQSRDHIGFLESQAPIHHLGNPRWAPNQVLLARDEHPTQHPVGGSTEIDGIALNFHQAASARTDLARWSTLKKAKVDSAPRLSLRPSTVRASNPAPVLGSYMAIP